MIFQLQYVFSGIASAPIDYILANYMVQYTNASSFLLSIFLVVHPIAFFCRPPLCALADRYRAHREILLICCLGCVIIYTPFVVLPIYLTIQDDDPNIILFCILTVMQFFGAICYDVSKSLADAMTLNYVSRIGTTYGRFRMFNCAAQGIGGLLIGFVNTGTSLPDYVAGMIIFVCCFIATGVLFYGWPKEYFVMLNESQLRDEEYMQQRPKLASNAQCFKSLSRQLFCCKSNKSNAITDGKKELSTKQNSKKYLNVMQQLKIMLTLMRLDLRLPLLMLCLVCSGMTSSSGQAFVQVRVRQVCSSGECNSSMISGYILVGIFLCNCMVLLLSDKVKLHHFTSIQIGLLCTAMEYTIVRYLTNWSPYFYLVNGAHGIHGLLAFLVCVKKGREFANRVEHIIPQLKNGQIIDDDNDIELVKISLAATMLATFVLFHEGIGATLGRLALGTIIQNYGYDIGWLAIVSAAIALFLVILVSRIVDKTTGIGSKLTQMSTC